MNHPTHSRQSNRTPIFATLPEKHRVWIVAILYFIGLWISSLFILIFGQETRNSLLIASIVQSVFAFILPAYFSGWLVVRKPVRWLGISIPASSLLFIGVWATFIVSLPLLNYLVDINSKMQLPQWASAIEHTFRQLEDSATRITNILLDDTSVWGLVSGIAVIGIIGPIGEELFFRGALQRSLYGPHPWKAVWWTAFIFSLLHFQMYGFLPRFLLGLWFGYLFLWSGSVWICIFAHILNNTTTVVAQWFIMRGELNENLSEIGTDGNIYIISASMILSFIAIAACRKIAMNNRLKHTVSD